MKPDFSAWIVGLGVLGSCLSAQAFDFGSALKSVLDKNKNSATSPAGSVGTTVAEAGVGSLTSSEMTSGLKEALGRGAEAAVAQLGKKDGFLATRR